MSLGSSESSSAVRGRRSSDLESPASVRRKTSLSRLPAARGMYMAGRTGVQSTLMSDRPGDASAKSATAKFASAIACPAAVDKRKTVTAIRSLSARNSATKSVPLKAMAPPAVTSDVPDHANGMFHFLLDIYCIMGICRGMGVGAQTLMRK